MTEEELKALEQECWEEALQEARNSGTLQSALDVITELESARKNGRAPDPKYQPSIDFLLRVNAHLITECAMDVEAAVLRVPKLIKH